MLFVHAGAKRRGRSFGHAAGVAAQDDLRQPEIKNLGVPASGDEQVRWLDVSVNDALAVRGVQTLSNLDCQGKCRVNLQGLSVDVMLQRLAIQELHRNKR